MLNFLGRRAVNAIHQFIKRGGGGGVRDLGGWAARRWNR